MDLIAHPVPVDGHPGVWKIMARRVKGDDLR